MREKKYINDYALREEITPSGKTRSYGVYVGPYYKIRSDRDVVVPIAKRLAVMSAIGWIMFLLPLCVLSVSTKRIYSVLPYAFLILPLGGMVANTIRLFRYKEEIIRSDADLLGNRYPLSACGGTILSAAAFVGCVIAVLTGLNEATWGDGLFAASAIYNFAFHFYAFGKRKLVAPVQISD